MIDKNEVIEFFDRCAPYWNADMVRSDEIIDKILDNAGVKAGSRVLDKTTPRLIQFHIFKNAVNPPFLGGFSIFATVAA